MSHDLLVEEARRRREIFEKLDYYLKVVSSAVEELDPRAEVYLFGSVAEGKALYSSDIDILVLTELEPSLVISKLWEKGVKEPFQVHVRKPSKIELYRKSQLIKLK